MKRMDATRRGDLTDCTSKNIQRRDFHGVGHRIRERSRRNVDLPRAAIRFRFADFLPHAYSHHWAS